MTIANTKNFFAFSFILLLMACTNQQTYEAVQQNRLQECQKLPPTAAEKCKEQHSQSYEDYQKNREEVLDK